MQQTTEELPKLTRQEKWRVYDALYKKRKYDNDPEYRKRKQQIALKSYYKRRAEQAPPTVAEAQF